jgi:hypothetical protein
MAPACTSGREFKEDGMKRGLVTVICLIGFTLAAGLARADDIQAQVGIYGADNAAGYMQPLADALAADMNGGLYHCGRVPTEGFHIALGAETMIAPIGSGQKSFSAHTEDPFSPSAQAMAPTIFGPGEGSTVLGTGGTAFIFPGGFELKRMPLVVPQLTIGTFLRSEATVRFATIPASDQINEISLLGLGVRHNLNRYLPELPLDLAGGLFWQQFKVQDVIDAHAFSLGLQGSVTRSVFSAYAGLAYEKSTLDLSYPRGTGNFGETVSLSMDAKNSIRLTLGGALKLAYLQLHASYDLAAQSTIVLGVALGN